VHVTISLFLVSRPTEDRDTRALHWRCRRWSSKSRGSTPTKRKVRKAAKDGGSPKVLNYLLLQTNQSIAANNNNLCLLIQAV